MPQKQLDCADIDTRFEQMGGKTMVKRINVFAMRELGGPLRVVINPLGGPDGHRLVGSHPWKQPVWRTVQLPIDSQFGQQAHGKGSIAILSLFALLDANQHAVTFDVRNTRPGGAARNGRPL